MALNLFIIISARVVRGRGPATERWPSVSIGRNIAELIARQIIPLSKSDIIERSNRFAAVQLLHWRYFCRSRLHIKNLIFSNILSYSILIFLLYGGILFFNHLRILIESAFFFFYFVTG